jgi:hypothetical protein
MGRRTRSEHQRTFRTFQRRDFLRDDPDGRILAAGVDMCVELVRQARAHGSRCRECAKIALCTIGGITASK